MAMEDNGLEEDLTIVSIDLISSLPDNILHHILSFVPTKSAIRASVLSKRWKHLWSRTPSLSFDCPNLSHESITETLTSYSAATELTSFHLSTTISDDAQTIYSWIQFAMYHNVEKLSLEFHGLMTNFCFPLFFYDSSHLKELTIIKGLNYMPTCTVLWRSLKKFSLSFCSLSDETLTNILSGCPMLESLKLHFCDYIKHLDLTKLKHLRILDIDCTSSFGGRPVEIIAPQVHYLRLRSSMAQCTRVSVPDYLRLRSTLAHCNLVDVSDLIEANVDVSHFLPTMHGTHPFITDSLQIAVQTMLDKFLYVEKLTFGVKFLQVLSLSSLSDLPGTSTPTLNVKTITLETMIMRSVVPGIARLLQNSPGLKTLTVHAIECRTTEDFRVNSYLDSRDLNPSVVFPPLYECQVVEPELVKSFIELVLANTTTLETLVLRLGSYLNRSRFEELVKMASTLSHNNKVSILLK